MTGFPFQDPLEWFIQELNKAQEKKIPEPTAMQLATSASDGSIHIRTVLFKGIVRGGLSFYTNYESEKAKDLAFNSKAALNFFWPELAQQIRFQGIVDKLTREESEDYFQSRPRLSQIGAWASLQSQEIPSSEWLEQRVTEYEKKFAGQDVPCPLDWGGYRLQPLSIEFWFGKTGRLHDRFIFERSTIREDNKGNNGAWRKFMRSP